MLWLNHLTLLAKNNEGIWFLPILGLVFFGIAAWEWSTGVARLDRFGLIRPSRDDNPLGFYLVFGFKLLLGVAFCVIPFLAS